MPVPDRVVEAVPGLLLCKTDDSRFAYCPARSLPHNWEEIHARTGLPIDEDNEFFLFAWQTAAFRCGTGCQTNQHRLQDECSDSGNNFRLYLKPQDCLGRLGLICYGYGVQRF